MPKRRGVKGMNKLVSVEQAVNLIKDGDTVAISGFQCATVAEEVYEKLAEKFLETGSPKNLTIYQGAGNQGTKRITYEGLIKRYVTGHYASNQPMIDMVNQNKIESYNLPQGVIDHIYRAVASGKVGEITKIGLNTYIDPRQQGGKMNDITKEDLVQLLEINGEEYLIYKAPKFDIGIIRGTTADEHGNISFEEESSYIDALDIAMAAKNSGGKVIVQVKNYVKSESMDRASVHVPGVLVDAIVITSDVEKYHKQTLDRIYDPVVAGHYHKKVETAKPLELNNRKIIARRAAMELKPSSVVNLGIGIPELIAHVANEEGFGQELVLTIESGLIGGIPVGGKSFGSAINAWASLPMTSQFDFYNGGGLNVTFLGFAEIDPKGNINVSKFGLNIAGCGGFIDISQSTKRIVFCGTFTAGGLKEEIKDGKVTITKEGRQSKFLDSIEQITFSADMVPIFEQDVMIITERCVFKYEKDGLTITEIAPGIDLEKDIFAHMGFKPNVSGNLKLMDERVFRDELMGIKNEIR
jgi:propionate CoA-transferase